MSTRASELASRSVPWAAPDGSRWQLECRFARQRGRLECVEIHLTSPSRRPITASLVRSLPVGQIIEQAATAIARSAATFQKVSAVMTALGGHDSRSPAERVRHERWLRAAQAPRRVRRARQYGHDHFRAVAEAYLGAWMSGSRRPTAEVAAQWNVSHSTAAKWVVEARRLSLLGPTVRGKAGVLKKGGRR